MLAIDKRLSEMGVCFSVARLEAQETYSFEQMYWEITNLNDPQRQKNGQHENKKNIDKHRATVKRDVIFRIGVSRGRSSISLFG